MIRNGLNIYNIFPPKFPKDFTYSKIIVKFEEGDLGKFFSSRKCLHFLMCLESIWEQFGIRIL